MHYLLIYETVQDYVTQRTAFRELHLAHAQAAVQRGELVLGGASGDPVDGAVIVFSATSAEVPQEFAKADPYVINGLVKHWYVKPWHTVVGQPAAIATNAG
ncbi:MAG: YciI-like protein [Burkholderiaceae bacterium]